VGTVREDYSPIATPWSSFPFEQAHRRAYRWGEDGLGGICDRFGFLNIGVALWNGRDPILKERLFGLTNGEGNHGEDAKEYWWAIDGRRRILGCDGCTAIRRPSSRTRGCAPRTRDVERPTLSSNSRTPGTR